MFACRRRSYHTDPWEPWARSGQPTKRQGPLAGVEERENQEKSLGEEQEKKKKKKKKKTQRKKKTGGASKFRAASAKGAGLGVSRAWHRAGKHGGKEPVPKPGGGTGRETRRPGGPRGFNQGQGGRLDRALGAEKTIGERPLGLGERPEGRGKKKKIRNRRADRVLKRGDILRPRDPPREYSACSPSRDGAWWAEGLGPLPGVARGGPGQEDDGKNLGGGLWRLWPATVLYKKGGAEAKRAPR